MTCRRVVSSKQRQLVSSWVVLLTFSALEAIGAGACGAEHSRLPTGSSDTGKVDANAKRRPREKKKERDNHNAVAVSSRAHYYVDPQRGSDANPGTSTSAPWKTLPGTRTSSDRSWLRSSWGDVGAGNRVAAGAVIELIGGGVHGSGRVIVDQTFYQSGKSSNPTRIQVSAAWGPSAPFTIDGSKVTVSEWGALFEVANVDYITIGGVSSARRLVVRGSRSRTVTLMGAYGQNGKHQKGITVDYLDVAQGAGLGMDMSYSDSWRVSNSRAYNNGTVGFSCGGVDDNLSRNGTYQSSQAYGNGKNSGDSGLAHGFGLYGCKDITYARCSAYNNRRDGFDFGSATNVASSSAVIVGCTSHDNGEDGFGANGSTKASAAKNTFAYRNCQANGNAQSGWDIYGGATVELDNVVAHHNGNQQGYGGNVMVYSELIDGDRYETRLTIRNSVGYAPSRHANVYSYDSGGVRTMIQSDNNVFVPRSSDGEVFAETPYGKTYTYDNLPSWVGSNDCVGIHCKSQLPHNL